MDLLIAFILTVGAAAIIIPFWNVLVVSFATQKEYAAQPVHKSIMCTSFKLFL